MPAQRCQSYSHSFARQDWDCHADEPVVAGWNGLAALQGYGEVAYHVADEGIAPGIPQHRLGLAAKLRRQFARPPSPPDAGPRRGQAGPGQLADEVALELGQHPKEIEQQLTGRGGGVESLVEGAVTEPPPLEPPRTVETRSDRLRPSLKTTRVSPSRI